MAAQQDQPKLEKANTMRFIKKHVGALIGQIHHA
jgi:hypothetical protein